MSARIAEFPVKTADGRDRLAFCNFATVRDLDEIALWSRQVKGANDAATADALEFAALSSKRWRFYHGQGLTVASIAAMKRRISAAKDIELAFFCVARAEWASPPILGIALARRTWCGHLALEFLATHPSRLLDGTERVSGIGKGLLYGLAEVEFAIGAKILWGEATKASAPIYQHIFGLKKVDDLLFVPRANLSAFRRLIRQELKRSNLRAT